jgi:TonB family protein
MSRFFFPPLLFVVVLLLAPSCSTYQQQIKTVTIEAQIKSGIESGTDAGTYRYTQQISNKIEIIGASRYPTLGQEIPFSTYLDIELVISNSGKLKSARLLKSSQQPTLDEKMMELVRYSAPYPPLPDELNIETLIIQKRWHFNSNN